MLTHGFVLGSRSFYNGFKAAKAEPRLLGTVENEVTSSKDGPNSEFEKHIEDADILITTPFHPGYLTRDLMNKAKNLKVCVTAGVGLDHIDLNAAVDNKLQVLEVLMSMLVLVRNFVPANEMVRRGDWNVADIAQNAFDLEGKTIETEKSLTARRVADVKDFVSQCDIVTINAPLHEGTRGLINKDMLKHFKPGSWLVNTARGAICEAEDVAAAVKSGQLRGYAGDVWNVQPAPKDHPWRSMVNPLGGGNGMTPHYSGTTLDVQIRYAEGTKEILENFFDGKPQEPSNVIVGVGKYESKAYGQR
ncbi:hypothetical protein EVG20_g3851 [Dentipellis fragilis]|uniref:Formate dehydrogenase n=1 Tax=Dentipellis fragilis TaxID=205917 RepID=A0A4Y9Z1H5_9AGAM|nr:hypothetical protein EVG20_g3851 [Dentipellis fragilis]